ncbi:MAG: cytochrome b N-terminal domain-containing protein [Acidobacteriota bacterium]
MAKKSSKGSQLMDWLDERTGLRHAMDEALNEPIPGGARWSYVFGSLLLFLLVLQIVTGIVMSLYYVPSADHAHASVAYIQKVVPGGALLRGIHHYGSSAMIILAVAHLAQTFLFGAYKRKRELIWVLGVVMLLIVFAFGFTGYLLPWDQAAYFGTKVGASIAGEIPVIGSLQQRIMLGGTELSTVTLSRFFTTHVFLLPLALIGLAGLHVMLFRKAGPAGPYHDRDNTRVDRFYPKQVFNDSVATLAVFVVLVYLALKWPAELGPVADPTSDYLARPPWYFMPLFQLLKYFPGKYAIVPTVVVPAVIFGALLLLPFLDRRAERNPFKRPLASALLILIIAVAGGLIYVANYQDSRNPEFAEKLKQQDEEMHAFFKAPFQPQQVGAVAAVASGPATASTGATPAAYLENCADCHGAHGEGDADLGPALTGLEGKPNRSKDDLLKILDDARAYGLKKPMPQNFPDLTDEDKKAIVEWMVKLK